MLKTAGASVNAGYRQPAEASNSRLLIVAHFGGQCETLFCLSRSSASQKGVFVGYRR